MRKMPSTMGPGHTFARVPSTSVPRSQFDRSHAVKTTFDSGKLVPVYVDEALPGDTFHLRMTAFARLATPLKPLMDNLWLDTFFFAVPYRLVWSNWHKFNGEQENPGDSTSFTIPVCTVPAGGYNVGTVEDYFGLPVGVGPGSPAWTHSALWRRAYMMIYNEWFRDENLCGRFTVSKGDGPDAPAAGGTALASRGKRHDYFTSCLPWPQKGTAVTIPLATGAIAVLPDDNEIPSFKSGGAGSASGASLQAKTASGSPDVRVAGAGTWAVNENLKWDDPNLKVDLSTAVAPTINALRQAFQIQKLLERDARGGSRYTEIVRSHFGVISPDARLQRPEYLGGGTSPIIVSPIAQTTDVQRTDAGAAITGSTPQGNLSAMGTGTVSGPGFVKSFTEHCLLIGLVCVRADLTYQQGLDRMWSRSTRYDFYWPALAQIGEQTVLNKEIYVQGTAADDTAFGYQERYAEYRYKQSRITGKFRSGVAGTLDIWHLAQSFSSLPVLNETFINEAVPLSRVMAVPTEPQLIFDSWFNLKCARPMPVFGVPGLIDHF